MKANQGTIIMPCTCTDSEQDAMYGKGNRLHNKGGTAIAPTASCTVCSPSQMRVLRHFPASPPAPITGYNSSGRVQLRPPALNKKSIPRL